MNTVCLPPTVYAIQEAALLIQSGEIVAFPTETVYGLGADVFNPDAITKIFYAKRRPQDNPLIVHIADPCDVSNLCYVEHTAKTLIEFFFPGPLTLVMRKKDIVPKIVTAGLDSVAIRMPSHPIAHAFIKTAGVPIAAPSANHSGKPSPTTAAHVMTDLSGRIPMVLDGGECNIGIESTVLDVRVNPPVILRPGGVTKESLDAVVGSVRLSPGILNPLEGANPSPSPGMRHEHYAPNGTLILFRGSRLSVLEAIKTEYDKAVTMGYTSAIFAFAPDIKLLGDRLVFSLGNQDAPQETAKKLYALLRSMDEMGISCIYSTIPNLHDIGLGVVNRLVRAARFSIIDTGEEVS